MYVVFKLLFLTIVVTIVVTIVTLRSSTPTCKNMRDQKKKKMFDNVLYLDALEARLSPVSIDGV